MKKLSFILVAFLLVASVAKAEEFYPGWQFGIRGGVNYSVGEASFDKLLSPSASITAGYQFKPWVSLRGDLSGWESKGYVPAASLGYKFNYVQFAMDVVFDFCGMCKDYKFRVVNPYALVGIGANFAFNNGALDPEVLAVLPSHNYPWTEKCYVSPVARIGLGIDFNVCRSVAITLEAVDNILPDKYNSKQGDTPFIGGSLDCDFNITTMLGVKFMFGQAKKAKAAAANAGAGAAVAATSAAATTAAVEAAAAAKKSADTAEKAAAEAMAAEAAAKAAAENAANAANATSQKVALDKAAFNRALGFEGQLNPYFKIGSAVLDAAAKAKLDKVKDLMNAHPNYKVNVVGYADKETGNPATNRVLSEKRAKNCAAYLEKAGVAADRMIVSWKGDTEIPFSNASLSQKRTVIFFSE